MTFEEIRKQILDHREVIRHFGVHKIGFFGSYVRGQQKADSDIDIVVDFEPDKLSFDSFMELTFYLEDLLGTHVDVLTPDQISPYIMPYIRDEIMYESI